MLDLHASYVNPSESCEMFDNSPSGKNSCVLEMAPKRSNSCRALEQLSPFTITSQTNPASSERRQHTDGKAVNSIPNDNPQFSGDDRTRILHETLGSVSRTSVGFSDTNAPSLLSTHGLAGEWCTDSRPRLYGGNVAEIKAKLSGCVNRGLIPRPSMLGIHGVYSSLEAKFERNLLCAEVSPSPERQLAMIVRHAIEGDAAIFSR